MKPYQETESKWLAALIISSLFVAALIGQCCQIQERQNAKLHEAVELSMVPPSTNYIK